MRLGGPIPLDRDNPDPELWTQEARACGYTAANWPIGFDAPTPLVEGFVAAAGSADLTIAEVGAWSNPLSPDEHTRRDARERCVAALETAERVGARCCVNIAGSFGEKWDGPAPRDLTEEAFDRIVETVRGIIDEVKPTRTYYALETMPGRGALDYAVYLEELSRLDADTPLMLEHLHGEDEYRAGADYIRGVAEAAGLGFR